MFIFFLNIKFHFILYRFFSLTNFEWSNSNYDDDEKMREKPSYIYRPWKKTCMVWYVFGEEEKIKRNETKKIMMDDCKSKIRHYAIIPYTHRHTLCEGIRKQRQNHSGWPIHIFQKKNITRPDDVKRKIIPIDKQIAYLMILMYFFFHSFSPW